jgi:hypothetical protein
LSVDAGQEMNPVSIFCRMLEIQTLDSGACGEFGSFDPIGKVALFLESL